MIVTERNPVLRNFFFFLKCLDSENLILGNGLGCDQAAPLSKPVSADIKGLPSKERP